MQPVRKAVIPSAGLGTRSLPATKSIPKEMLTIVDRPIIQYAVEEARAAGIEVLIFVTSRGKTSLEDHFDHQAELYSVLQGRGKSAQLAQARSSEIAAGRYAFVRQPEPMGLGHAVWCARQFIGNEPFAVLLPDEVFLASVPPLKQMLQAFATTGGNLVGVREVPLHMTNRYGILDPASDDGHIAAARDLVEKPEPDVAPSRLSVIGRYILQPDVLDQLDRQPPGAGGEIQLTDAIAGTIGRQPLHGVRVAGERFDCGDCTQLISANLAFSLRRPELATSVRAAAERILSDAVVNDIQVPTARVA
ncbi:MAG: UTP--glucose-1-phosphate uridylyltransferase [Rhodospirillaceae bacterium]|nr:UTP--glucose-1-phosphate uridylyltransferase [Rhodospirillaceae bacterium]